ncbi:hypothetical protein [Nostoc sp.]|uniref:hypothetical protein n=1 Tax=Nostoc sp. TaxID=1180 RepID=UPI002FF6F217
MTLTGDAFSVAIAKKSLVVLYRETNVRQFLLGSHCVAGVPPVEACGVDNSLQPFGHPTAGASPPFGRRSDCLTTTLAHRTRKFES